MFELIKANKRRSALLIFCFVVLLSLVGAAFGVLFNAGPIAAIIALVFSGAMAFFSYWKADAIALAVSRAKPADPQQYQRLVSFFTRTAPELVDRVELRIFR